MQKCQHRFMMLEPARDFISLLQDLIILVIITSGSLRRDLAAIG